MFITLFPFLQTFRPNTFQISMMEALVKNQPVCLVTYCCPCCCAMYTRYRVLDSDMTRYRCCQGYLDGICCFSAGSLGEEHCPEFCLCLESLFCLGPSMSSSRMFIMDQYELRPDPCDNRLVRCSNCLMLLSCVCDILAIFIRELRNAASLLQLLANCMFYSTMGCMAGQVNREVDFHQQTIAK